MDNRRWFWLASIGWGAVAVIWSVLDMAAMGWGHGRGSMWFNAIMGAAVLALGLYRLAGGRSLPHLTNEHTS